MCCSNSHFAVVQGLTNKSRVMLFISACLLALISLVIASPSFARSSFDGDWSVVIQTRGGACPATVRYPVAITNGVVINTGDAPASVRGRVAPNAIWWCVGQRLWPPHGVGRQRHLARTEHERHVRRHLASGTPQLGRSCDGEECANV